MEITVEDLRTGKVIKLGVEGYHRIDRIIDIVIEHTGISIVEGYSWNLAYKGMDFSGAIKFLILMK